MTSRKSSLVTGDSWPRAGWDGDTVPAIKLSHLTESQRMAFLSADNRLTENSSWDERMLGEQLKILSELKFGQEDDISVISVTRPAMLEPALA